ncbi:hypothetical protein [Variovorax davisae]|uniref:hypothetical protein n=1 Tax=Variovorax davisae TaxID=3053515 RepID=UPI00257571A3|nr:hypothetical protein [Variovorax sp. J22P271]
MGEAALATERSSPLVTPRLLNHEIVTLRSPVVRCCVQRASQRIADPERRAPGNLPVRHQDGAGEPAPKTAIAGSTLPFTFGY